MRCIECSVPNELDYLVALECITAYPNREVPAVSTPFSELVTFEHAKAGTVLYSIVQVKAFCCCCAVADNGLASK